MALILHGNTINGGVALQGGGGGESCAPNAALSTVLGSPIPAFSAFEGNIINGGLSVTGYQSCWLGLLRNTVHGTVTVENNLLADPDAVEVASNSVYGNLVCSGNSDTILGEGSPNTVTGQKLGQCASR